MVVRIQIAFKTIHTENGEFESKEDHLTAIELSETDSSMTTSCAQVRTRKLENKNVW